MISPNKPPTDNRLHVIRGGGWNYDDPAGARAALRYASAPAVRRDRLGFRCAQRGARMPLTGG